MAALFRALFGCCLGQRVNDQAANGTDRLPTHEPTHDFEDYPGSTFSGQGIDDERTHLLNQKVSDIVSNAQNRMLVAGVNRPSALYSPILGNNSSSVANSHAPSTSRLPQQQPQQRSQPGSHHSSQSSRHSSYRQHHPSLLPHAESEARHYEDGTPALETLNGPLSFNSSGNIPRLGYGTMSMGAPATARRFQIHRGRPPARKKSTRDDVGTNANGQVIQGNGVLSSSEPADEQKDRPESSTSPHREGTKMPSSGRPLPVRDRPPDANSTERKSDINEKQQVHFQLPDKPLMLPYDD